MEHDLVPLVDGVDRVDARGVVCKGERREGAKWESVVLGALQAARSQLLTFGV